MFEHFVIKSRLRAAVIHLGVSALIGVTVAALAMGLWYPWPYRDLSGGLFLVGLLVVVDVVLGPVLTLVVFKPEKGRKELWLDMLVVVCLQCLALSYGLWSLWTARPVQLVYEYGQFGVVRAAEVDPALFPLLPSGVNPLPWNGPGLVALRPMRGSSEQMEATMLALMGAPLAARVDLWQPYANAQVDVLKTAKPITDFLTTRPEYKLQVESLAHQKGVVPRDVRYLPLVVGRQIWTVLIEPLEAGPIGFLPVDPL